MVSTVEISVVVPVYNGKRTIRKTLDSLLSQKIGRSYEIIAVDDGSRDETPKILSEYRKRGIRVITQKNAGPASARNAGWKKARGKIVAFTDSDCRPVQDWLSSITKPFSDRNVGGVGGTYRTENRDKILARYIGLDIELRHSRFKREIEGTGSFSIAFRKNLLERTGGFDETYRKPTAEDFDLCFAVRNLGKKIIFEPKAIVYHYHPEHFSNFMREQMRHARARAYMYKKFTGRVKGESYTPLSTIITAPLSFLFIATFPLFFLGKINPVLPIIPSAFFAALFILALPLFFYCLKKRDYSVALISIPVQLSRFFAWTLGVLAGFIDIIFHRKGNF
ncbi:MAG: glycosyltransferase [Candidatus Woesearchaeota archaeon]|nr:glycosyltransferase [Candidatus Woesearchaeota archaeon]